MPKIQPPQTLTALAQLLKKHGRNAVVVRGPDDGAWAGANRAIIDSRQLRGFSGLGLQNRRMTIGGGATFGDILRDVEGENGLLKQAVSMTASPLVRNRVTLLTALDPESPYFDIATALVSLDARVRVQTPTGSRVLGIEDFLVALTEGLNAGEFPSAVDFPPLDRVWKVGFFRLSPAPGKPTVSAAVRTRLKGNAAAGPEIVVSSSTIIPVKAPRASKELAGRPMNEITVKHVSQIAAAEMLEIAELEHDPYESSLIQVAVARALRRVTEGPTG